MKTDMRKNCIYCNEKVARSGEHYLPRCLGKFRNFEQLYDKLCPDCNGKVGQLDEQFCRSGPEAFFRIVVGVKGRKHHQQVSPFYRGSAGAEPIVTETTHPTLGCSMFCEVQEGGETAYPARQIIVRDAEGKCHSILITDRIKTPADLLDELKERNLQGCEGVECYASTDEQEFMETLCKGANFGVTWNEKAPPEVSGKKRFVTTFTVNDRYFRALAKIAFHYFLKQFSHFSGSEQQFAGIREFIMKGGDSDLFVRQIPGSFVTGLGNHVTTDHWGHLLAVDKTEKDIIAMMHFFVGPRSSPDSYYRVYLGKNAERIIYPQSVGHQFVYFDHPDNQGYTGRVDPLLTVSRKLIP
jgi:hypothetical protein